MPITGSEALSAGSGLLQSGLNIAGNLWSINRQARHNMKLAKYQNLENQKYLKQQLEYDKPVNQMTRFAEAGLNPNLIYDKGTGGNQGSPLQFPDIKPTDMTLGQLGSGLMDNILKAKQAKLLDTQADLNNVKVTSETVKQQLQQAQEAVIKANPLMDKDYFRATVKNMESIAIIKQQQANASLPFFTPDKESFPNYKKGQNTDQEFMNQYQIKVLMDFEEFLKKQKVRDADLSIKSEVKEAKDYKNDFEEIQNKWLMDADISWQTVRQMMLMYMNSKLDKNKN
jgi:hypothetical protein